MSMYYLINLVHTCLDGGFIAMILEGFLMGCSIQMMSGCSCQSQNLGKLSRKGAKNVAD